MKRNPKNLTDREFDLLVVGGGIHGAAITWEATRRGLKTALIEKGDFGQATSANSLKIIHGGLRYLQQADLKRMRQSIKARRRFMEFAPHLVQPQPFLIPLFGHGLRGREIMALGLALNDLVSWDRNQGLQEHNFLPRGRVIPREVCLSLLPGITKEGLTGGAVWYDGLVQHTERLTLEFILSAADLGATTANYIQATSLLLDQETVNGVKAIEVFSQTEFPIRAGMVVNASGPWLEGVFQPRPYPAQAALHWAKGINLVINKPLFTTYGVGLEGPGERGLGKASPKKGSRFFFFVPWQGQVMVGTEYHPYQGDPGECRIEKEELEEFLEAVNDLYPPAGLGLKNISFFHFGLLPLSEGQWVDEGHPEPDRQFKILDHESLAKIKGLISIKSTKYTTAPLVAEKVVDLILAKGKRPDRSHAHPGSISDYDKMSLEKDLSYFFSGAQGPSPGELAHHFWENYGPRSKALLSYGRQDPQAFQAISPDPPLTKAEVIHGIREEMALKLSDIVFRRTSLARAGCPKRELLDQVAQIMAAALGWDGNKRHQEIEEVLKSYGPLRAEA